MPFFSVVIPVYNRERLIGRAIESVLLQDFDDFEVVVVDDASHDRTREVVQEYATRDTRVRLVCHETNRHVCSARNTGVDAARAPWIIFLDSDDEIVPGGLTVIAERARAVEADVALLRFACRWDDGSVSPAPPLADELWDYAGFIRFLARTAGHSTETLMCVRRETFETLRWPEGQSHEGGYHLAFAQRYLTRAYGHVARLYHADAANSGTFAPDPPVLLRRASAMAGVLRDILEEHGEALRKYGPACHAGMLQSAMKFSFLAGDRAGGLRHGWRLLVRRPVSLRAWVVLVLGLAHPGLLARFDAATALLRLRLRRPRSRRRNIRVDHDR